MKKNLFLLAGLIGLAGAQAQEPIYFTAELSSTNLVPPGTSAATGEGTFSLVGNILSYSIMLTGPGFVDGEIHGPAGAGTNAPAIFFLPLSGCSGFPFDPSQPTHCYIGGTIAISREQTADLLAGLWYVNIVSPP